MPSGRNKKMRRSQEKPYMGTGSTGATDHAICATQTYILPDRVSANVSYRDALH